MNKSLMTADTVSLPTQHFILFESLTHLFLSQAHLKIQPHPNPPFKPNINPHDPFSQFLFTCQIPLKRDIIYPYKHTNTQIYIFFLYKCNKLKHITRKYIYQCYYIERKKSSQEQNILEKEVFQLES